LIAVGAAAANVLSCWILPFIILDVETNLLTVISQLLEPVCLFDLIELLTLYNAYNGNTGGATLYDEGGNVITYILFSDLQIPEDILS
jgi:hypothetical protein